MVDGAIIATITKTAESGPELKSAVAASFLSITVPRLLKITAANDNADVLCRIRSKPSPFALRLGVKRDARQGESVPPRLSSI